MRNSCEPCRKRKIKCSQEKPTCGQCERLRKKCVYLAGLSARDHIANLEEKIRSLESQVEGAVSVASQSPRSNTPPLNWDSHAQGSTSTVNQLLSDDQISLSPSRVSRLPLVGHLMGEIHLLEKPNRSDAVRTSLTPSKEIWRQLLAHYCDHTSTLYPIFHLPELVHHFHQVLSGEAVSRHVHTCVMMVLAVSMTSLAPQSPLYERWKQQAPMYYASANQHYPPPCDVPTVERLQLALINLQYVIYNPNIGSIWNSARTAVSVAVELNLHHESPDHGSMFSPLEQDLRRRLFWVTYSHERNVCITLGRPPAIPDNWINTPFPIAQDESGNPTSMAIAIHRFRLRLLQSEVQERLYSPSASLLAPSPEWYHDVVRRLDEWRSSLTIHTGEGSPEWLSTKYHLTLLLLHGPSPCQPTPSAKGLSDAMSSAGAVMRSFRELHRTSQITYNWFTVYQLFVANVTYLNCLYQALRSQWNIVANQVEAILDLQASSTVIQAVVAVTPGLAKIRDACEAIGERSVRMIMSAVSPAASMSVNQPSSQTAWPDHTDYSAITSNPTSHKSGEVDYAPTDWSADPLLDAFLVHPVAFTPAADWERIFGIEGTFD